MAHWYDMWNTIVVIHFWNAKEMICALMFMIINHHGIKCLCNLLQLEPSNVMFKVITDIAQWYEMWKIQLLLQLISAMQRKWFENLSLS